MSHYEIPDNTIEAVAKHINERSNKIYNVPIIGNSENLQTPQYFEIKSFAEIDDSERRFYAIDGSYNSELFYNGLAIAVYAAGYICFNKGKQIRLNSLKDPVILGQAYYPNRILVTTQDHLDAIYDELFTLTPVKKFIDFLGANQKKIFAHNKETICTSLSTLLSFCQEVLEFSLILEIADHSDTSRGDFILRDGTLRSLQIKQHCLIQLAEHLNSKGIIVIAITKQSPIKMELAYTFKQIDSYLQDTLKHKYPFTETDPKRKKLCCWFEVPDAVLKAAYQGDMFARKAITGGRGFGLFFAARLDYVEKLQNYDWVIVDVNILDAIPGIKEQKLARAKDTLDLIFKELTRLTQEHYILGYPYPLAEAHNFVSLKKNFKEEIINRLKYSLYKDQRMDNVDIENLFLDTHDRF